ncbi:MAG TPA: hypothetical protein VLG46_16770, partial [Anaerolineae bacterium]|nr:hypothetical protein [Anaerolineae bacterium]
MHTTSLILRVSLVYICVLFLVRLSGKRSVGRLSPIDFVMAVIIGEL